MWDPNREQRLGAASPRFSHFFYIPIVAISVFLIAFFVAADIQRVLSVIPEDAAYFFKIAENYVAGKGFTFDGINQTNGFQPLWLYTLIPISSIYHGTPETMFRLYLIIQVVLVVVSMMFVFFLHSRIFAGDIVIISVVFSLFMVFIPAVNGMESAILVFTLSILYSFGWHGKVFHRYSPGKSFLFGLILGLCVLSRLDTIFLALAIGAFCCIGLIDGKENRKENFHRLVLIVLGSVVLVLPYILFNWITFGGIMPISGALKSSFPVIHKEHLNVFKVPPRFLFCVLLAFLYFTWYLLRGRTSKTDKPERGYFRASMAVLSAAVIIHFLHTLLFMKWAIFNWHFISYALFASLAISEPADIVMGSRRIGKFRGIIFWLAVIVFFMIGGMRVRKRFRMPLENHWHAVSYNAAIWARDNTEESDVFAMSDAGNFGYFSKRAVINLDGVVNNFEYQRVIKERKLKEYFKKHRVAYIVQHAFLHQDDVHRGDYETLPWKYYSHKYETYSDVLLLRKEDEVYRSKPYYNGPYRTVFLIWKLNYRK